MSISPVGGRNNTTVAQGNPLLDSALAYLWAGLSVIPIKTDGSKAPAMGSWRAFAKELPSEEAVNRWWREGTAGIGLIGGGVSGNLQCIDFHPGDLFAPPGGPIH